MKSLVLKRSVIIAGHKSSVSLEEAFWNGLKEIAANRKVTLSEPQSMRCGRTATCRQPFASLSSTIIVA